MKKNKLTVAMPVFNCEEYITESIDSILAQTFKDFTFLIIDDGSTDNTVNIIQQYENDRIKLIQHSTNKGRPEARNTALDAADSEYFAWMDADDISHPHRLEKQIRFLEKNKHISICGTNIKCFQARSDIIKFPCSPDQIASACLFYSPVGNATAMMRLDDIRKHGLCYDSRQKRAEDFAFWADVFLSKRLQGYNLQENLFFYRIRPQSGEITWYWHKHVLTEHVFPAINISFSDEEADLHSCLTYLQRKDLLKKYDIDFILSWLIKLYNLSYFDKKISNKIKNSIKTQIADILSETKCKGRYIIKYREDITLKSLIKIIFKCIQNSL